MPHRGDGDGPAGVQELWQPRRGRLQRGGVWPGVVRRRRGEIRILCDASEVKRKRFRADLMAKDLYLALGTPPGQPAPQFVWRKLRFGPVLHRWTWEKLKKDVCPGPNGRTVSRLTKSAQITNPTSRLLLVD